MRHASLFRPSWLTPPSPLGSLMPPLVMKLIFGIVPTQAPFLVRPLIKAIMGGIESGFLNGEIYRLVKFTSAEFEKKAPGGKGWFAGGDAQGQPTMADFMMLFPIEAMIKGGRLPADLQTSSLEAWLADVHAR